MRGARSPTEAQRDRRICRLYLSGRHTQASIASDAQLSRSRVGQIVGRAGVRKEHADRAATYLAMALLRRGVSVGVAARVCARSRDWLSAALRDVGVAPAVEYNRRRCLAPGSTRKKCAACGHTKPLSEFYHRRDSLRPEAGRFPIGRCKVCERARLRESQRRARTEASTTFERDVVRYGRPEARRRRIRRRHRAGRQRFAEHIRRVEQALEAPEPLSDRKCLRCLKPFTPTSRRNIYCSDACSWRQQRSRRRAREREAYVEDVEFADIYARDGGVCQLCHEPVDRRCKYPHPRSAVLDHIIPFARDGKNERRNVQLAHHGCNDRKGAGSMGSQLRCVG